METAKPRNSALPPVADRPINGASPVDREAVAVRMGWLRSAGVCAVWIDRAGTMRFLDARGQVLARLDDRALVDALSKELSRNPNWAKGQRAEDNPERMFLSLTGCVIASEEIFPLGDVLVFRSPGRPVGIVVDDEECSRIQQILGQSV